MAALLIRRDRTVAVLRLLAKSHSDARMAPVFWRLPMLEDFDRIVEERFGRLFHPASISRVVRRLGFSGQKARPSHPEKDLAAQAAFKKNPSRAQKDC